MGTGEPFRGSVHIAAEPDRVFDYFTNPEAITRWMGQGAVLDPRPGGEFTLYITGVPVQGRYLEVDRPRRIVITWGRGGSEGFPPGTSTLEVIFTPDAGGTTVSIEHRGLPTLEARAHALGWGHYLARLAIAGAGADPGVDPWESAPPPEIMPDS